MKTIDYIERENVMVPIITIRFLLFWNVAKEYLSGISKENVILIFWQLILL